MTTPLKKLMLAMAATFALCLGVKAGSKDWMVVDLKTGSITYYGYDFDTATNTFNTAEYKLSKMVFRRIAAGDSYYVQNGAYTAQMAKPYYIGIFPVTVAQYALMGDKTGSYTESNPANLRAQGSLNRTVTRGTNNIPSAYGGGMYATSNIGKLNALVREANANDNLTFDLPTRAMWEVAARAIESGDETHKTWSWFFGETSSEIAKYGFIKDDSSADDYGYTSMHRVPGSRLPNAWGLYDVFGNVREICLENNRARGAGEWTQTPIGGGSYNMTLGGAYDDVAIAANEGGAPAYHDYSTYAHCGMRLTMINFSQWDGDGDGTSEDPYIVTDKETMETVLTFGGELYLKMTADLSLEGPFTVPTGVSTLTLDLNGGSITGATGQAAIILAGNTAFSATGTGTISADDGIEAVKRQGSVTASSGVTITGIGASGGAVVPAPAFPSEGASEVVKFAQAEGGKWTITAFAEMDNASRGTDVADSQIKVYSADTLEELKSVTTPATGATVKETKSAVKTVVEVPAPSGKEAQFFKVKFGE